MSAPGPCDPELAGFVQDFTELARDPQPVQLELSKTTAWILMAQLQLALRHPQNTGPPALEAWRIAEQLRAAIATTPALSAVAAKGWDPSYDQDPTDPQWASATLHVILEHLEQAHGDCRSCRAYLRGHGRKAS